MEIQKISSYKNYLYAKIIFSTKTTYYLELPIQLKLYMQVCTLPTIDNYFPFSQLHFTDKMLLVAKVKECTYSDTSKR